MTECFNFGSIKCGCMNKVLERSTYKAMPRGEEGGALDFK